jgi:hypothetical protein
LGEINVADFDRKLHEIGTGTPAFAAVVLACLGAIDLVRGFLHTFLVEHSAVHVAGMDLSQADSNQLMLLGAFGISNFLTGALFIAISWKARQVVPAALVIAPAAYLLGFIALRLNHVSPQAAFPGRWFMLGYLTVSFLTFVASVVWMRHKRVAEGGTIAKTKAWSA